MHAGVSKASTLQDERSFYDRQYLDGGWWGRSIGSSNLDTLDFCALWQEMPGSSELLQSLGDVRGKRMLLLGNGASIKEFLFVKMGAAHVTFTDLSPAGIQYAENHYRRSRLGTDHPECCDFRAVDLSDLPFPDSSYDVICAEAAIHHVEHLEGALSQIYRCLAPGGYCRFADTALSPIWQKTKSGILRSLQRYVHRRDGISPEDLKATTRGGYTLEETRILCRKLGFRSYHYERIALFDYLVWRGAIRLRFPLLNSLRPFAKLLDRILATSPIMQRQGISLIFGFNK